MNIENGHAGMRGGRVGVRKGEERNGKSGLAKRRSLLRFCSQRISSVILRASSVNLCVVSRLDIQERMC